MTSGTIHIGDGDDKPVPPNLDAGGWALNLLGNDYRVVKINPINPPNLRPALIMPKAYKPKESK